MRDSTVILKAMACSLGAAVGGSLAALLVGMCLFGFHVVHWTESQGRTIGIIATIAGVAGASLGLLIALRVGRRTDK